MGGGAGGLLHRDSLPSAQIAPVSQSYVGAIYRYTPCLNIFVVVVVAAAFVMAWSLSLSSLFVFLD